MIPLIINFMRPYLKYILLVVIAIGLFFFIKLKLEEIKVLKTETLRQKENLINKDFDISIEKTKSGQLEYSVSVLATKADELKYYNDKIANRLDDMSLKIKNLKSVTNIENHYETNIDTIKSHIVGENKFLSSWNKNGMEISGVINIPKNYPNFKIPADFAVIDTTSNANYPFLSNVKVIVNDTLLIASEIQFKRSWIFWKKPVGVKIHVKSENPYFSLDRIQTFDITK